MQLAVIFHRRLEHGVTVAAGTCLAGHRIAVGGGAGTAFVTIPPLLSESTTREFSNEFSSMHSVDRGRPK
jgi:hypothetical protein